MLKLKTNKKSGITLISLVVTIIVLLLLAGISIMMLTGNNGILQRASEAKEEMIVGQEKESVELAYITAAMKKLGSDVSASDLQTELNNSVGNGETVVTGTSTLYVHFNETTHNYTVRQNDKVTRIADGDELPQEITYTVTTLANGLKKVTFDVSNAKSFEELTIEELEILIARLYDFNSTTLRDSLADGAEYYGSTYEDYLRDVLNSMGVSTEGLTTEQLENAFEEKYSELCQFDVSLNDSLGRFGYKNRAKSEGMTYEEYLRYLLQSKGQVQSFAYSVENKDKGWNIETEDEPSFIATSNATYEITVTTLEGEEIISEVNVSGITYESMTENIMMMVRGCYIKTLDWHAQSYLGSLGENTVISDFVSDVWNNSQGNDNNLNDYEVYFNGNKVENSKMEAKSSIYVEFWTGASYPTKLGFEVRDLGYYLGLSLVVPWDASHAATGPGIKKSEFIIVYNNVSYKMMIGDEEYEWPN